MPKDPKFKNLSPKQKNPSLLKEAWDFIRQNKKFWLIPIILSLILVGLLILLGSSAAAPFIYPLF